MNSTSKNNLLVWLVILLLIANAATITLFWLSRAKRPPAPQGEAKDFLIKELNLDSSQQIRFADLRQEHRKAVDSLREKVKDAKDHLFDLVKDSTASDSMKQEAAAAVSRITEQIDLFTLTHFQKVRALCDPKQQKRFDEILRQVTVMMGPPRPPAPPAGPGGPPPEGQHGREDPPPPPHE